MNTACQSEVVSGGKKTLWTEGYFHKAGDDRKKGQESRKHVYEKNRPNDRARVQKKKAILSGALMPKEDTLAQEEGRRDGSTSDPLYRSRGVSAKKKTPSTNQG